MVFEYCRHKVEGNGTVIFRLEVTNGEERQYLPDADGVKKFTEFNKIYQYQWNSDFGEVALMYW
jgi:hypothetical protein